MGTDFQKSLLRSEKSENNQKEIEKNKQKRDKKIVLKNVTKRELQFEKG